MTERPAEQHRLIEEARAAGEVVAKFFVHQQLGPILASALTMQQLKLVALLHEHGPLGGHDLARHLEVSMPTVTGIVDRLVERGMVDRRADPTDRRVRLTALSPAGEAFVAEFEAAGWGPGAEILESLDVADLRALTRGLTAMSRAVEERVGEGGCRAGSGPVATAGEPGSGT